MLLIHSLSEYPKVPMFDRKILIYQIFSSSLSWNFLLKSVKLYHEFQNQHYWATLGNRARENPTLNCGHSLSLDNRTILLKRVIFLTLDSHVLCSGSCWRVVFYFNPSPWKASVFPSVFQKRLGGLLFTKLSKKEGNYLDMVGLRNNMKYTRHGLTDSIV